MRLLFILSFTCLWVFNASAQNICFEEMLKDGDQLLREGKTEEAILHWQSALKHCKPDASQEATLNRRINEAKRQTMPSFVGPEMVFIQGGTFRMGSEDGDSDEKPVHTVTVSSFNMGKYEITVAQFKVFVDDAGYNGKTDAETDGGSYVWDGKSWVKKAGINWRHDEEGATRTNLNHPVMHVSWNDATAYCQWLSKKTGKSYRLPTEAEWEYAAGNGAKHTKYSWGNGDPSVSKGGSVVDESGAKKYNWTRNDTQIFMNYDDGYPATAPVGSFASNDFGLYDMTGNVWEWCSDWKGEYSSSTQQDPIGATTGSYRVRRGGGWLGDPQCCRATNRNSNTPTLRNFNLGFRLVRSPQ